MLQFFGGCPIGSKEKSSAAETVLTGLIVLFKNCSVQSLPSVKLLELAATVSLVILQA